MTLTERAGIKPVAVAAERLNEVRSTYFPFPNKPRVFKLGGFKVYDYISPETVGEQLDKFSPQVDLSQFDALAWNRYGAEYFLKELLKRQKFSGPIFPIEYRWDGSIPLPIPNEFRGNDISLGIIEDVWDRGQTALKMLNDAPSASFLFMVKKIVPKQLTFPSAAAAIIIDNVWYGGCGANLDAEGDGLPHDFAREYPGIIAKILSK